MSVAQWLITLYGWSTGYEMKNEQELADLDAKKAVGRGPLGFGLRIRECYKCSGVGTREFWGMSFDAPEDWTDDDLADYLVPRRSEKVCSTCDGFGELWVDSENNPFKMGHLPAKYMPFKKIVNGLDTE